MTRDELLGRLDDDARIVIRDALEVRAYALVRDIEVVEGIIRRNTPLSRESIMAQWMRHVNLDELRLVRDQAKEIGVSFTEAIEREIEEVLR